MLKYIILLTALCYSAELKTADFLDMTGELGITHIIIYDIVWQELAVIEVHNYPETINITHPAWIRAYTANKLRYELSFGMIEPIILNSLLYRQK